MPSTCRSRSIANRIGASAVRQSADRRTRVLSDGYGWVCVGRKPERLARRLGLADAVVIGLGAMLGAGIFAAPAPAAEAAGSWLLAGLVLASVVAYANATSSAQLAALYPEAGGTYVYARHRLGDYWGFLAGWSFVVGKTASLAAMALTFGSYVAADLARPVGIAAVVALTAVNYLGVQKTAKLTSLRAPRRPATPHSRRPARCSCAPPLVDAAQRLSGRSHRGAPPPTWLPRPPGEAIP